MYKYVFLHAVGGAWVQLPCEQVNTCVGDWDLWLRKTQKI